MNKKAALGIFLAVGVALIAFFIMKFVRPVEMPHRIFYDSVSTKISDGKRVSDTIWSRVPNFELTNQLGQKVSLKDLEGKIIVADFFFTTCPAICPLMTTNMKKLQDGIRMSNKVGPRDASFIHFLSFSVDPERDSVSRLKQFADRYQIDPQNWWLLTGDKKQIYDLALEGMKLGISETEVDTAFIHPTQFVLIDKERVIRARRDAYGNIDLYNGLDTTDIKKLAEDIILLSVEKDPNKESVFSKNRTVIIVVFAAVIAGLFLLFTFLKKEKRT